MRYFYDPSRRNFVFCIAVIFYLLTFRNQMIKVSQIYGTPRLNQLNECIIH